MGLKILHVEDDLDIQEIAKLSLETIGGFEILQCASGKQALEEAHNFKPDLFLFDVQMPEMSGDVLYQEIKVMPDMENIPAIFMTARAQAKDVAALKELGALDVVTKPFDPMTLPDQIREILAR
ncbi:MAG: response regulator [Rhodobacteraceae bacterium]|nr:response regulator [Paracoccaceae bacterium]